MHVAYLPDKVYKDVGTRRQLFIDNDVIAVVKNLTRRQHGPKKHPDNPLIKRDKPWEVTTYFRTNGFSVVRDPADGLFKCWYEDYYDYFGSDESKLFQGNRVFYARSEDGLLWEKPPLGRQILDGRDTNSVFPDDPDRMISCASVLLDLEETDPSRRFKMVYYLRARDFNFPKRTPAGRHGGGLCLAFSPNGIDWTHYSGNPIFPVWMGDAEILYRDPLTRQYVIFGRYGGQAGSSQHPEFEGWFAPVSPGRPEGMWGTRRRSFRTESADCMSWPTPTLVFDPDQRDNLDDGHYNFVSWRTGEQHLGLLMVLHQVDNTIDMYLHHSRDGLAWDRLVEHRPFIPRGGLGSHDQFLIEASNPPLEIGDELWFYYGGVNVHHDWWIFGREEGLAVPEATDPALAQNGHHLCLATMRLDGYVSLDATVREGWVETKPVFSTGNRLLINGRCKSDGYIEVEVMDNWNNVWDKYSRDRCETFTGDAVRHQVKWSGRETVSEVPSAVKLRFHLRNAELYSFQFA